MRSVPGLFIMNDENFAQDIRLSIRGFGSRSAFGIRGIKLFVDGFPQTTADGQSQVDNINLSFIKSAEIIRGSSSSIYGNASGGVIQLFTEPYPKQRQIKSSISIGDFGYRNIQSSIGDGANAQKYMLKISSKSYDGYRDNSEMNSFNINMKSLFELNQNSTLSMHYNYVDSPLSNDPGSLNKEQAEEDRRSARIQNIDYQSGEKVLQHRFGASYKLKISNSSKLNILSFYTKRIFSNKLPFENGGQVDLKRSYWGLSAKYIIDNYFLKKPLSTTIGVDFSDQSDRRKRYNNIKGIRGSRVFDQLESFINKAFYFQQSYLLNDKINVIWGSRWDDDKIESVDYYLFDGLGSGFTNLKNTSPFIGMTYLINNNSSIFANFSNHYETPTLNELSNDPDSASIGGFNTRLTPQVSNSFELGLKGYVRDNLFYEFSLYRSKIDNEITSFELESSPGKTYYRNVGETQKEGIEVSLSTNLRNNIRADFAYTYSQFEFSNYTKNNQDLNGNRLPGLPQNLFNTDIYYINPKGYFMVMGFSRYSNIYLNDSNDQNTNPYSLLNLRLGNEFQIFGSRLKIHIGVNNVLNENYYSNLRVNAWGGRFYEPAPLANFYFGAEVIF
jgi:iron complex outermembrane receptor protein